MILKSFCFLFLSLLLQNIAAADSIKIGVSVPLSGDMMQMGIAVKNGLELFKKETLLNSSAIQFIFEDNGYSIQKSLNSLIKLRDIKRIDLIYVLGDLPCEVIAPLAEKYNLPMIAVSFNPLIAKGKKFILPFASSFSDMAKLLTSFFNRNNFKRLGIIMVEDPYYENLLHEMKLHLKENSFPALVESVSFSENNFMPHIQRIQNANLDVIGIFLWPGQISTFYRQAKIQKLNIPTFGADVFESKDETEKAQGAMNGAFYINNQVNQKFLNSYRMSFGNDEQITYAGNIYEFATLFVKNLPTINRKNLQGIDLIEQLTSQDKISGSILGDYKLIKLNNSLRFSFSVFMKIIEGNTSNQNTRKKV